MVSSFGENYKKLMIGSSSGLTIRAKFTCFDGLTKGSNVISAIIISCRRSLKEDVVSSTNEIKKSIGLGFCFPYLILILYGIKCPIDSIGTYIFDKSYKLFFCFKQI